jgi:dynamin 1-like protein
MKLDLVDAGTHALDILTGQVYLLKVGFISIINRSQRDINSDKSMTDMLERESEFFKDHMQYGNVVHKNGIKHLAPTLNLVRASLFSLQSHAGAERCIFYLGAHESYTVQTT